MLLVHTRQVARQVFERYDRNIEAVAETDKAGGLVRRVAVEHTSHHQRLVGDKTDRFAVYTAETDHDIGSEELHHFEELAFIDQRLDHVAYVVRYGRIGRDDFGNVVFGQRPGRSDLFRFGRVVGRNHRDQLADLNEALVLAGRIEVGVTGHLAMYFRSAEFLHRNLFAENGLNDFGTGDKHFGNVLDYEDEVGQGGGINGTAGTRAEDHRNLRNHAARQGITEENLTVPGQCVDAFLDTSSTRVVDADQRNAHVQRIIHDLGDFTGVHKAERTAGYGKVLCKDGNRRTQNGSGTDNHAVAGK